MKPTILVQLDTDPQPSVFDAVVGVDAGVDHLLRHGGVEPEAVRDLVYGALFTRGPTTSIARPSSSAARTWRPARRSWRPSRDASSATSASRSCSTPTAPTPRPPPPSWPPSRGRAGRCKGRERPSSPPPGPVGRRVARLLAREGATVAVGSRQLDRAQRRRRVAPRRHRGRRSPRSRPPTPEALAAGLDGAEIVVAAGAAGVVLLPEAVAQGLGGLKIAIDLNAVPPLGIEGVKATDRGADRDGVRCWGALGVGGTKMKIHRKAIQELFTSRDKVLDAEAVLALGKSLG